MRLGVLNLVLVKTRSSNFPRLTFSSLQFSLQPSRSSVEGAKPVITYNSASISGTSCISTRRDARHAILVQNPDGVEGRDLQSIHSVRSVRQRCLRSCRYVVFQLVLPPISLLRCSPKPQNGCCRTLSYPCIHSLAAYGNGTSDTCPVVLDVHFMTTNPTHPPRSQLGQQLCFALHYLPRTFLLTCDPSSAASNPLSHSIALHTLPQPQHQSSPRQDASPRLPSERRNQSNAVLSFGSDDLDHGQLRA